MNRNVIFFCLFVVFAGCGVSSENLPEPDKLKREIVNNITIPFNNVDTVIYESYVGMCGNSSEDEFRRYYLPQLDEQPYRDLLKAQVAKTILCTAESGWDHDSKNNLNLILQGEAVTNSSVKLYEDFYYNKAGIQVEKLFTYENNKWKCKIISQQKFAR